MQKRQVIHRNTRKAKRVEHFSVSRKRAAEAIWRGPAYSSADLDLEYHSKTTHRSLSTNSSIRFWHADL